MMDNLNYISDKELEQLISQVEQEELVTAPPDLMESILGAAGFAPEIVRAKPKVSKKKEFYAYCFRVITSVAAAVALTFILPVMTERVDEKTAYGYEIPDYEEVVAPVQAKAEVVAVNTAPGKEEVLNETGLMERIIRNTGWFKKDSTN